MAIPRVYISLGTVSIATGASAFTGTGTLFSLADLEGADLWIHPAAAQHFHVGMVAANEALYPEELYENLGPVPLVKPWRGAPVVDQPYVLALSPAIVTPSALTSILSKFVALLRSLGGLVFNAADLVYPTDYALIPNNSFVVDDVQRTVDQWRNGVLERVFSIGLGENPKGPWVGDPVAKFALAIATGDVAIDYDDGALDGDGRAHFSLTVDGAAELQDPTNVAVGDVFDVLFTISGGPHAITATAAWPLDIADLIRSTDGASTRIRVTVVTEAAGVATAVSAAIVTFAKGDMVEHGAANFVSNRDANDAEPQFDGAAPISTNDWTWKPAPTVQSVLDELGIHSITISTLDPTGGVDGDLWFKVQA